MKGFRIVLTLLLVVVLTGLQKHVQAQFEGEINFLLEDMKAPGDITTLDFIFTNNRISIESASRLDVMPGLRTNSVLVRNDLSDFLFRTGEREAYQIAKSDIDALMNLINRVQGRDRSAPKKEFNWEQDVRETGNTRTIQGYETNEFVLTRNGGDEQISVWLTDDIKVNWGLLEETWHTTGARQIDEEVPVELVMNRNSFPLLIEVYQKGILSYRAESAGIKTLDFDISKTEMASDTQILGLSDLMMNMIRQRR
ncbi:MAG: hypothetical protein R3283_06965 [Balneolaceae bacterium]|nr:hypothetical protein [Balneolaceae bacterium]